MMKHTPTPWHFTKEVDEMGNPVWDITTDPVDDGWIIAHTLTQSKEDKANASFIVRAVNAHEALVEALEAALNMLDNGTKPSFQSLNKMNEALKLAKGE